VTIQAARGIEMTVVHRLVWRLACWLILTSVVLFAGLANATALGDVDSWKRQKALSPLIAALRDQNWYVRQDAAKALGQIGGARAVEPLIAALRDQDRDIHEAAAEALGQIGDARAVDPLIAALRDQNGYVREAAAEALGQIGDARTVDPLIAALRDQNGYILAAARALGQIGDARAVEPLIATLQDQNEDVRLVAAGALGQIGDAHAVEPLIAVLRDQNWVVRWAVAGALEQIGDARAVEPFIAALRDQDGDVREAAAGALGQIGDTRAVEPLIAALRDQDGDVRRTAAEALVRIGHPAVEPLIATLRDQDGDVRGAAAGALAKIDPHWPQSEAAWRQVPNFSVVLWTPNTPVYQSAMRVLKKIGNSIQFTDALGDADPKTQLVALAILDANNTVPYPERGYPHMTGTAGEKIDTALAVTMTAAKRMRYVDALKTAFKTISRLLIDTRFFLGWRLLTIFALSSCVFLMVLRLTRDYYIKGLGVCRTFGKTIPVIRKRDSIRGS
jgi:HEAT repeat protein